MFVTCRWFEATKRFRIANDQGLTVAYSEAVLIGESTIVVIDGEIEAQGELLGFVPVTAFDDDDDMDGYYWGRNHECCAADMRYGNAGAVLVEAVNGEPIGNDLETGQAGSPVRHAHYVYLCGSGRKAACKVYAVPADDYYGVGRVDVPDAEEDDESEMRRDIVIERLVKNLRPEGDPDQVRFCLQVLGHDWLGSLISGRLIDLRCRWEMLCSDPDPATLEKNTRLIMNGMLPQKSPAAIAYLNADAAFWQAVGIVEDVLGIDTAAVRNSYAC